MTKVGKKTITILGIIAALLALCMVVLAITTHAEEAVAAAGEAAVSSADSLKSTKAIAAAIVMGGAAMAGAVAMALSIMKSVDGIARQPEAEGKIRTAMMLGLVFIETAIIYALIVAILIVFVL